MTCAARTGRNGFALRLCEPLPTTPVCGKGCRMERIQTIATDHCPFFYDGTKPILYEGKPVAIPGKELGEG